jgi:hypothetical protein
MLQQRVLSAREHATTLRCYEAASPLTILSPSILALHLLDEVHHHDLLLLRHVLFVPQCLFSRGGGASRQSKYGRCRQMYLPGRGGSGREEFGVVDACGCVDA